MSLHGLIAFLCVLNNIPLSGCTTPWFIHLPIEVYLGSFQVLVVMNKAIINIINIHVQDFVWKFFTPLGKYQSKYQGWYGKNMFQFSSVTQSCPTLCDPMNCSMPDLPILHQLPEFTQTHAHWVSDAIQSSHPLSSPSPAPNPSQHQGPFQWVNASHEVAKALEFQL